MSLPTRKARENSIKFQRQRVTNAPPRTKTLGINTDNKLHGLTVDSKGCKAHNTARVMKANNSLAVAWSFSRPHASLLLSLSLYLPCPHSFPPATLLLGLFHSPLLACSLAPRFPLTHGLPQSSHPPLPLPLSPPPSPCKLWSCRSWARPQVLHAIFPNFGVRLEPDCIEPTPRDCREAGELLLRDVACSGHHHHPPVFGSVMGGDSNTQAPKKTPARHAHNNYKGRWQPHSSTIRQHKIN